jgi:hypothetical protein
MVGKYNALTEREEGGTETKRKERRGRRDGRRTRGHEYNVAERKDVGQEREGGQYEGGGRRECQEQSGLRTNYCDPFTFIIAMPR